MQNNPYIGPRPYRRGEGNFFGRSREARSLAALIMTNQVLLYYATSGAGKTSLLNAKVIPELEKNNYYVLPVARVGSKPPPGVNSEQVGNIFVFSALMDLAAKASGDDAPFEKAALQPMLTQSLLDGLKEHLQAHGIDPQARHPLLIFDQFEEILTAHRARWQDARGFFLQVRDALAALPGLGVVFAMREDYIAGLDPYTPLLPGRLRARFRMELMDAAGALEAVQGPAAAQDVAYAEGVAGRLVDDLRRIKTPLSSSPLGEKEGESLPEEAEGILGQYVEPVTLQIVCRRLWANLPDDKADAIRWDEIERYGNVNKALIGFYEDALAETRQVFCNLTGLQPPMTERRLRHWFGQQLITPVGTRGPALYGPHETAGLPNAAVEVLDKLHIIRSDIRAGARWYELCHDRLVEPILKSNREWEEALARARPWLPIARRWQENKDDSLLYRDKALEEALAWQTSHPNELEPEEVAFLAASQQAGWERTKKQRRLVLSGIAGLVLLAVMVVLTALAIKGQKDAQKARRVAEARQWAAQGQLLMPNPKGFLLAIESLKRYPTLEGRQAIHQGLSRLLPLAARVEHVDVVDAIAFSPDGEWLASGSRDGSVHISEAASGRELTRMVCAAGIRALAFSPTGKWLAVGTAGHEVELRRVEDWKIVATLAFDSAIETLSFSPGDRWLVAAGEGFAGQGAAQVWQVADGQAVARLSYQAKPDEMDVSVEFNPDRQWMLLLARSQDELSGQATIWDTTTWQEAWRSLDEGEERVSDADFSPDGQRLALGDYDGYASLWQARTWEKIDTDSEGISFEFNAAEFSSDRRWLATYMQLTKAGVPATISVWDVEGGIQDRKEMTRISPGIFLETMAFNPEGHWLAAGGSCVRQIEDCYDRLYAWNTTNWQEVGQVLWKKWDAYSRDGRWLATLDGNSVRIWGIGELERQVHAVEAGQLSPDGRWVAAVKGNTARLWATEAWDRPVVLGFDISDVAFNPGSQLIALAADKQVRVLKIVAGQRPTQAITLQTAQMMAFSQPVEAMAFSPDGGWFVIVAGPDSMAVWRTPLDVDPNKQAAGDTFNTGKRIAFSPGGHFAAVVKPLDGAVQIVDLTTGGLLGARLKTGRAYHIGFSSDEARLIAQDDQTIRVWDRTSGQELAERKLAVDWANAKSARLSPDGQWLVTLSQACSLCVRETNTWRNQELLPGQAYSPGREVVFSPDGQWLAFGDEKGGLRLWKLQAADQAQPWQERSLSAGQSPGPIRFLHFSPDGRWLAAGDQSGGLRLWQAATWKEWPPMKHHWLVNSLAFSSNGHWLASGSGEDVIQAGHSEVRIWELASGQEVDRIALEGKVWQVTFSPDDRRILFQNGDDRATAVMREAAFNPDDLIREACRRLPRNMTQEEWNYYMGDDYQKTCPDLPGGGGTPLP